MKYFLVLTSAIAVSAILTPLVRRLALQCGAIVQPRGDRWHRSPTPVLGGIAFVCAYTAVHLLLVGLDHQYRWLLVGGLLMSGLGLYDDLRGLAPQAKFIGQIIIAGILIGSGTMVEIVPWPVIAYPLSFLWLVGLTNAFNLIDNIDGLSAGIAAISASALSLFSLDGGNSSVGMLSLGLAGASIGFLFYNFNPARIFMGDCGSMFLGFMLAGLSLSGTWRHASSLFVTLLAPVLILSIPIFDTAFVTVTRKLRGQPVSQGGRDHLSHRLVLLGFSEKKTVLILYGLSAVCALGALFFNAVSPLVFAAVAFLFCVGLFYFCVYLGSAHAARTADIQQEYTGKQAHALRVNAQRFIEIFIDLALIAIAYFLAYVIRFESGLPGLQLTYFISTLPLVMVVKITLFYCFGLYQTIWRHVGVRDFINILKAVVLSTLIIMALILMYTRFEFFSRTVFVIDAMLCLLLVSGAHFSLRVLREYLESQPRDNRRVLLIGAGDAGEMALREIRNNPGLKFQVAGFVDDDPFKRNRKIHGVKVLGTVADIAAVVEKTRAREAFVTISALPTDDLARISQACREAGIECKWFHEIVPTSPLQSKDFQGLRS